MKQNSIKFVKICYSGLMAINMLSIWGILWYKGLLHELHNLQWSLLISLTLFAILAIVLVATRTIFNNE